MRGGRNNAHRGGLKGKPREKALLRSNVVRVEQTNSARRLQRDQKELEDQKIPLVGVSARPLSNSLYTWHGNLRGPDGTPFEGGVFHFELVFPTNYPVSPPTIRSFTPIPHPNVLGGTSICLDILDGNNKQIYQGWTSAYTVETILIQLQSFLFEELPTDILKQSQIDIREAIKLANNFKCTNPDCNHQGPIKPFPPFNNKEKDHKAFEFVRTEKEIKELMAEEFVCFHTKAKLKETTLGIGVSLARLPRTGQIRTIAPTLDLLSLRSFIKHKIRYSLSNEKFTHWLPLYFGENDTIEVQRMFLKEVMEEEEKKVEDPASKEPKKKKVREKELRTVKINLKERCIHLLKKSMSFICRGSTRKDFEPSMILEVMPPLILTHVLEMVDEYKHISILALRRLFNFIRLFRLLLDLYPEVEKQMDAKIEDFIKDPAKRHKDYCSSLGDFLGMASVSQKYKFSDILNVYLEEQLDRQAFWILRQIPELDHEDPKYAGKEVIVEEQRNVTCFKTGITGFHLTLFFFILNKMVLEGNGKGKDFKKFTEVLDANYGCLQDEEETAFQKKAQEIQGVNSFLKYYPMMGIPMPDEKALGERLKQAISNSRKKKYHGNEGELNTLPKIAEQAVTLMKEKVDPFLYYSEEKNQFLDAKDPKWEKACMDKFTWINHRQSNSTQEMRLKPRDFAQLSDGDKINQKVEATIKVELDMLKRELDKRNESDEVKSVYKTTLLSDYDETFTWRDLFFKLCFEQMIEYFPQHQDFKLFYRFINTMGPHIKCLRIPILDKKSFKSNHYWLMTLIGRMTHLKTLKLHKNSLVPFGLDGYKFLQKGFKYFQDNGGDLVKIQINNTLSQSDDYLFQCLKCVPNLRVLKISDCYISIKEAQTIGKVLSDFKNIQEVDLSNAGLDQSKSKEIADGLMRAKQLQILNVKNNGGMGNGSISILYNLAFSPKISHIDFSNVPLGNNDSGEALYKLIKISGSLEKLLLGNTNIINYLKEEFFIALGENKTLQFLNLDNSRANGDKVSLLGKACGMNKRKNGSLKLLSIERMMGSSNDIRNFFNAFKISDHSHELWYGDKKVANEMSKEQLELKFEFGLTYINFGNSTIGSNGFRLKDLQKLKNPNWPPYLHLVADQTIQILNFTKCNLQKQDMELFAAGLYENPVAETTKLRVLNLRNNKILKEGAKMLAPALAGNKSLEVLDLSECKIGVSGAAAIAEALMKNSTLKTLNLYRNRIDVDGARAIRELLKCNTTLEFLDVGHNRLRQKGIMAITDGICENSEGSKIKHLGVRFNFIKDEGFAYLFDKAILKGKSKIEYLYTMQNYLTEHFTLDLYQRCQQAKKNVYVDSFEKAQYLCSERMDRSIWISPMPQSVMTFPERLMKFFQQDYECGLIQDIRVRKGQKIPGKPRDNLYAIVEYGHVNSIPRSLRVASKKWSQIDGLRFRVYKAGTRTVVIFKSQKRRH